MQTYGNSLSVRWRPKAVPYGGTGEARPDGTANYGFRNLKGNVAGIQEVPELAEDTALATLVAAMARRECGLFSIGCTSGDVADHDGFRVSGYVEFAINSRVKVQDAAAYWPIFYHFDEMLAQGPFPERVFLSWELEPAHFVEIGVSGFTCSVIINTDFHGSASEARECWKNTLGTLELYFGNCPAAGDDPIY